MKHRTVYRMVATLTGAVLLAVVAGGASAQRMNAGTVLGAPRPVGQGTARSFITFNSQGQPTAIGVSLSAGALSGLPTEPRAGAPGFEYGLPLPEEAAGAGYTHVTLDWNPQGHPPPGVYTVPHFDFHFYLITPEERARITATGQDLEKTRRKPAPEFVPAGYILPPGTEVPRMGAHMINPAADEFQKKPLTKTFIYGSYDGRLIFLEPMVTKAFLESKPNVTESIGLPQAYPGPGYYPTRYSVKYDPASEEVRVSLEGLTQRQGP